MGSCSTPPLRASWSDTDCCNLAVHGGGLGGGGGLLGEVGHGGPPLARHVGLIVQSLEAVVGLEAGLLWRRQEEEEAGPISVSSVRNR